MRPSKDGTDTICMVEKYVYPIPSQCSQISPAEPFSLIFGSYLLIRYKDKKALKEHGESAAFQKFQKGVSEQDLLLAPPTIYVLSQRGGFSSRL
jgi:hypothetical protein